jgi:uncharacterized protein DUF6281
MTRRLAVCAAASAIVAVGLACGGGRSAGGGGVSISVDCDNALVWNGARYVSDGRLPVDAGAKLGAARVPPCRAPGQEGGRRGRDVQVHRLPGVPPALALGVDGEGFAYFAEGFLLALRSHPLHERVYGSAARPRPPSRRCARAYEWNATVVNVPAITDGIFVRPDGARDAFLELHAETKVTGFARSGHPYLRRGDLVHVRGVICPGRDFVVNAVRPSD